MGFCLFEHAKTKGFYFAVNASHVSGVVEQEELSNNRPVCFLSIGVAMKDFEPLVVGSKADIEKVIKDAAKIGMQKVEVSMIGNQRSKKAASMVFNEPDRIILARELLPDEFIGKDKSYVTASQILMTDGSVRIMVERPGIFAQRANAKKKIPILTVE